MCTGSSHRAVSEPALPATTSPSVNTATLTATMATMAALRFLVCRGPPAPRSPVSCWCVDCLVVPSRCRGGGRSTGVSPCVPGWEVDGDASAMPARAIPPAKGPAGRPGARAHGHHPVVEPGGDEPAVQRIADREPGGEGHAVDEPRPPLEDRRLGGVADVGRHDGGGDGGLGEPHDEGAGQHMRMRRAMRSGGGWRVQKPDSPTGWEPWPGRRQLLGDSTGRSVLLDPWRVLAGPSASVRAITRPRFDRKECEAGRQRVLIAFVRIGAVDTPVPCEVLGTTTLSLVDHPAKGQSPSPRSSPRSRVGRSCCSGRESSIRATRASPGSSCSMMSQTMSRSIPR